jgi:hypothetical protein
MFKNQIDATKDGVRMSSTTPDAQMCFESASSFFT